MTSDLRPVPKPLKRKPKQPKRMKARNSKRKGHAFPKNVNEPYREWIRGLPCAVKFQWQQEQWQHFGEVQACHIHSRGAGGPDRANMVPLCRDHHAHQHGLGIRSFGQTYGVNLKEIAAALWVRYSEGG